jgi:DNA-binding beta-propeller fold protein YncE
VYGGSVTRFLGGALRGVVSRVIPCRSNGVAVSVDGGTLLVSDGLYGCSHVICEINVADGSTRRVVGREGRGPLRFCHPQQVCIAPDGFVFVADAGNHRVQVLTPTLQFNRFIGRGQLKCPVGVCANADVVVVSESHGHCVSVFRRSDGALLRRFGSKGSGDGELRYPAGVCLMSGDRHVAVAENGNSRVSVFSVDGEFIRHVGVGELKSPTGVAASAFDELVVADTFRTRLLVFSCIGDRRVGQQRVRCGRSSAHGVSARVEALNPVAAAKVPFSAV